MRENTIRFYGGGMCSRAASSDGRARSNDALQTTVWPSELKRAESTLVALDKLAGYVLCPGRWS